MSNAGKLIQDLILFYVKENYNHYLEEKNIQKIPDEKIKGTRITTQGNSYFKDRFEKREDPRGNIYYWMTGESVDPDSSGNTDNRALKDGYISVTPIHYRLTNESFMSDLESWKI